MRPLLLTLLLAACVPKGRYELAQIQLEATQTAFQTREEKALAAVAESQHLAQNLKKDLTERELQVTALQDRVGALERQVDQQAEKEALDFVAGVEACPPLPEPPPCPECQGEPVERPPPEEPEPPEVTEKRVYVEASIEEVSQALKRSTRFRIREAERNRQHQVVFERLSKLVDDGYAEIIDTGDETIVRLLVAKLFNENRTTLSPLGEELVKRLATGLNGLDGYKVHLVGHTDDRPLSSIEYPSNWELGFAYAVGLLRGLEYEGYKLESAVTSMAGTQPVVAEKTEEARRLNRRVELHITFDASILDRPVEPPQEETQPPEGPDTPAPEEIGPEEEPTLPGDPAEGLNEEEQDAPEPKGLNEEEQDAPEPESVDDVPGEESPEE